jgi:hypothetical protein
MDLDSMANTNAPFGLKYVGVAGGSSAPTFSYASTSTNRIAYNYSTAVFKGDPVQMLGSGYLARWAPAVGVSQLWGIFDGCNYLDSNGKWVWSPYWPGGGNSGTGDILCSVIPCQPGSNAMFLAQSGNSGGAATEVTIASIGQNVDVAMGSGNTRTGLSTAYIDTNTDDVTATLPFTIVGLYSGAGGSLYQGGVGPGSDNAANNWVYVTANINQRTGI